MEIIEEYKRNLLSSIPVVEAMDLNIEKVLPDEIHLSAPLNTNINYEGTAFGGSINTICVLSAYLLVHHSLKMAQIVHKSLVIQDSSIKYLKPITDDFIAIATTSSKSQSLLIKSCQKKGLGRIEICSKIYTQKNQAPLAEFRGRYVVQL